MPIEPVGHLVQPPQAIDPMRMLSNFAQFQYQREASEALRQQRIAETEKTKRANDDQSALDQAQQPGFSLDQVLQGLPGHLHTRVREEWAKADKSAADAKQAKATADNAEADYLGQLAASVKAWEPEGPDAMLNAAQIALKHAQQQGHDVTQIGQALQQQPNALPRMLEALIQASPKQRELMTQKQNADTTKQRLDAELPGITADASVKAQVAAGTVGGMTPQQQAEAASRSATAGEIRRHNVAEETNQRATQARENAKFDATYGQAKDETGQPVMSPIAKAIAEYRQPGFSGGRMSDANRAVMAQVLQINPGYDATQFPARNRMRVSFTSGQQGQALNSLNTAIEHLDQFADAAKALGNGSFQPTNALVNWAKTIAGDSAPTNFDGIKTIMAGELASAFKKSGATDTEIANVEKSIAGKQSPAQLVDYVTKIAIPAVASKAHTYQSQWAQTMGERDPYSVYTPGARAVVDKYKNQPTQNAQSGSPQGGPQEGAEQAIPGIQGGVAKYQGGKWIRIK